MYCENCELHVSTELNTVTDADEAQRYRQWFDNEDLDATYFNGERRGFDAVGDKIRDNDTGHDIEIKMRVDVCANCAVPIKARTYGSLIS